MTGQSFIDTLKGMVVNAMANLYPDCVLEPKSIIIAPTKPDFEGDYSLVLFPFIKALKTNPNDLGKAIGEQLCNNPNSLCTAYNITGGFLNISLDTANCLAWLANNVNNPHLGTSAPKGATVMVEYSSPNTNKPLHFGHLRTNFLGYAVSNILKANGYDVVKANLINDRGIHICKSMLAWETFGNGDTPASTGMKGDHFVGKYYVRFNTWLKEQIAEGIANGLSEEEAEKQAPVMAQVQDMLRKWEAGDEHVMQLWTMMNGWVYEGFDETYAKIGVDFDKVYYESQTYLLGKAVVLEGLEKGVFYQKEDGSVWVDLTNEGLDHKLLLRADGTSVYMTQDLGTALLKDSDYHPIKSIYVIGDEQNYHMQVLKLILQKMGKPAGDAVHHLSYGMVELPTGRLKSREGTTVDADDMAEEMIRLAQEETEQAGKTDGMQAEDLQALYKTIGLGALKFYLLRVDPKKKMIFNPKESIDLHGFTAAFIQYAHARICSILQRVTLLGHLDTNTAISAQEKALILQLEQYPSIVEAAGEQLNPSLIANYLFSLAQNFNSFYDKHSILKAESEAAQQVRVHIITLIKNVLKHGMNLLGIEVPNRM